jgi:hypothetical protein
MDFHAHLARTEVLGLLAGHWDPALGRITVRAAFPCRSLSTGMQVRGHLPRSAPCPTRAATGLMRARVCLHVPVCVCVCVCMRICWFVAVRPGHSARWTPHPRWPPAISLLRTVPPPASVTCTHTHTHTHTHTPHTYTQIHTHTHTQHTHTHTYTHTHVHTHTRTHTHTHRQTDTHTHAYRNAVVTTVYDAHGPRPLLDRPGDGGGVRQPRRGDGGLVSLPPDVCAGPVCARHRDAGALPGTHPSHPPQPYLPMSVPSVEGEEAVGDRAAPTPMPTAGPSHRRLCRHRGAWTT